MIPNSRVWQRGFTLIEMLVVVVIIAVSVSVLLLSTNLAKGSGDLKSLGNDLGKLIHLLYQEAIFENRNYAISLKENGYQVLEYNGEDWLVSNQSLFRKIKLGSGQESTLTVENQKVSAAGARDMVPHILILSSGEMTAFTWDIDDTNVNASIVLEGDLLGNIQVTGPIPHT